MTDITELVCQWVQDDLDEGAWKTECGNYHLFTVGTPQDNDYKFCPYCGKELCEVDTPHNQESINDFRIYK